MSTSGPKTKSFDVSKELVWEAYRRVAANKGAAGVDGMTLEEFEKDLKNNLYRIWNRMSSGTYFRLRSSRRTSEAGWRHEKTGRADRGR